MRWLSASGLAAAVAVGASVLIGLGWRGVALLFAFFVSGSLLTQTAHGAADRRTARQVIANGGVAAVAALAGAWWVAAGALAAATADTWATEIGAFSRRSPRLITTGRLVAPGSSGGITWLGTAGGVGGAAVLAGLAWVLQRRAMGPGSTHPGVLPALAVAAAGVVGMLADSVLGATLQGRFACPSCGAEFEGGRTVCHAPVVPIRGWRWLDNDGVNLGATLVGAGIVALGWRWLS